MRRRGAYRWPGNIRELEHCIESDVVPCGGTVIDAEQLSPPHERRSPPPASSVFVTRPLADVEREHIVATRRSVDGNRSEAARSLGIGRNTLLRELREYRVG